MDLQLSVDINCIVEALHCVACFGGLAVACFAAWCWRRERWPEPAKE